MVCHTHQRFFSCQDEVVVGGSVITSTEELGLVDWRLDANGRMLLSMIAVEQDDEPLTLEPVVIRHTAWIDGQ